MVVALLGYFGTMVAALAALMLLLNVVLSSSLMPKTRPQPYPVPVIGQTVAPQQSADAHAAAPDPQLGRWGPAVIHKAADGSDGWRTDDARVATVKTTAAEKAKHPKWTSEQKRQEEEKRQEDMAGRTQDQEYSQALGYGRDAPRQPPSGALFDFSTLRRF
jgi:hypothetical protein